MTQVSPLDPAKKRAVRRQITKLVVVLFAMFGFGYTLVPLYNAVCRVTGLNGKIERTSLKSAEAAPIDTSRWVTVEFTANTNQGMPWDFKAEQFEVRVHPGEIASVKYYARNPTSSEIIGQAIDTVTPGEAAPHFKKIQCFCFGHQDLKPGETRELPVRFVVDAGLPKDIDTITLSYTFFNVTKTAGRSYIGKPG